MPGIGNGTDRISKPRFNTFTPLLHRFAACLPACLNLVNVLISVQQSRHNHREHQVSPVTSQCIDDGLCSCHGNLYRPYNHVGSRQITNQFNYIGNRTVFLFKGLTETHVLHKGLDVFQVLPKLSNEIRQCRAYALYIKCLADNIPNTGHGIVYYFIQIGKGSRQRTIHIGSSPLALCLHRLEKGINSLLSQFPFRAHFLELCNRKPHGFRKQLPCRNTCINELHHILLANLA